MTMDTLYTVKAIIAYGATPKTDEPIGIEEVRLKARAEAITDSELGAAIDSLLKRGEILSPEPGAFRLAHKEGWDAL